MRTLAAGMKVNYVQPAASGKAADKPGATVKATIVEPHGNAGAIVDYSEKGDRSSIANAPYSQSGEGNTFHFIDEAGDVKSNQKSASQQNGATSPSA